MNSLMRMMSYGGYYGMGGAMRGMIVTIAVIAALIGLAQLLWGYKLLRFWIAVQGFGIGGLIGGLIALAINLKMRSGAGMAIGLIVVLVCAVLGAFLAYTLYKVGVFLQCFACGFLVAMVLFGALFGSMGLGMFFGMIGGIGLGVLGVILTKPMFIITTSISGGLSCGMALGNIAGGPIVGIVLSLGLIALGLWYQITHNNGLFELPGAGNPAVAGAMAAGAAAGAAPVPGGAGLPGAGGMSGAAASGTSGLPSSVQLPPLTWRLQRVLICVGIAAAATLIITLLGNRRIFSSLVWAVAVTGAAGYIWRGNFSRENGVVDIKDQLIGIAVTVVPTIVVGMILWQLYYTPMMFRIFGMRGIFQGFMSAFKLVLPYMAPVLALGVLWKESVPSPLFYRPEKEDINRMLMGAVIVGGIMAGVHVITVFGTILTGHGRVTFRLFMYVFCYILVDVVTAAAMTYVWGRRGIYRDTEADQAPVRPAPGPMTGAAAPSGQPEGMKASPLQGVPVFNAGFANPVQQPVQTSKYRRKITAGMVKAENTHEYWREGAPLALTQMTLTEQMGQLSLTLGLQNLTNGVVNAIYLDIDCYNVLKEKVAQLRDVSFLDLKVGKGNIFFNSIPVQIPDATVRQCEICLRHVVYVDETIWNGEEGQYLEKLEPQKYLADEGGLKPELADEFCRIMAGNRNKGLADMKRLYLYSPERREGYWYCSCGQINLGDEEICTACGIDREEMFAMQSPEFLTQVREDRLAEEKRRAEEEERLRAERIAERNRKIEETKAAAKKKAQELVSQGRNYGEKVQGYVSSLGSGGSKEGKAGTEAAGPARICPNCQTVCQPGTLFCISCGTPLTQPTEQPAAERPASGPAAPQPELVSKASEPAKSPAAFRPEMGSTEGAAVPVPEAAAITPEAEAAQKPCPVCNAMCGAEDVFCVNCGASLKQEASQKKICPNCGRENKESAKFCIGCGTKLI